MMIEEQFRYDATKSESDNFNEWHLMNTDERESAGQAPYSKDMARRVFDQLRSSGWLTTSQSAGDQEKSANS